MAKDCPLKKPNSEATGKRPGSGSTNSGSVSAMKAECLEDRCQRLRHEWMEAEFSRLSQAYIPQAEVDTVKGALGPLYYATVMICGVPVEAMIDPGSSASIMSFELFKQIGLKAGIPKEALKPPEVSLRDYSQRPIPVGAQVELEVDWNGEMVLAPVYLRSDQGTQGEPCLLGTNVIIPLGLMVPGTGVKADLLMKPVQ